MKTDDEKEKPLCGTEKSVLKEAWSKVKDTVAGYRPRMKNPHKKLDGNLVKFYRKKG
jgi:hypothetical protein